jgi:hypothetical protein
MISTQESIIKARLSLQRALLGEVPPALRAVVFSMKELTIASRFYFDGPISQEDDESVSCVETEVLADYDQEYTIAVRCIRLDFPLPIYDDGVWVYHRREKL